MKVTYKGEGGFSSNRIAFNPDIKEYEVANEIGEYLVKTFPSLFAGNIAGNIAKAVKEVEEKPKAEVTPKKAK